MINKDTLAQKWPKKNLGDVVDFLDHIRKPVKASERIEGVYPYYGANGQQGTINDFLFNEPLILLAEDGGFFGCEGKQIAYKVEGKCWVNNHAHVLRPKNGMDINFLLRHLEEYNVLPFISGTTRAKLTKSNANTIPILVPPIKEQKRIAAILDKADIIRRKREQVIELLDILLKSVFLDMFGDPVINPMDWKKLPFEKILKKELCNGLSPSKSGSIDAEVLTLSAITGNMFDLACSKIASFSSKIPSSKYIDDNKFLICRGNGNLNLVGRGKRALGIKRKVVFPDTMISAEIDETKINTEFLSALWEHKFIRMQIERNARTTNGTFKINQKSLETIEVIAPPINRQKQFSSIYRKSMEAVLKMRNSKKEALFESLSQKAFRGDL